MAVTCECDAARVFERSSAARAAAARQIEDQLQVLNAEVFAIEEEDHD